MFLFSILGLYKVIEENAISLSTKIFILFCILFCFFIIILKKENTESENATRRRCITKAAAASKECCPSMRIPSPYFRREYRKTQEWQVGYANLLLLKGKGFSNKEWRSKDENELISIMEQCVKVEKTNQLLKRILLKQLGELEAIHDYTLSSFWGDYLRNVERLVHSKKISIPEDCDKYLWKCGFTEALFRNEMRTNFIFIDPEDSTSKEKGFAAGLLFVENKDKS